jgi:hypothetical protein
MRYLRFTNWLTEIDRLSGPVAAIWFEEVRRHAGTDAAHVYGGLMATLTAWAELRGVPYAGVPVGTIKHTAWVFFRPEPCVRTPPGARTPKNSL